jgi:hypothetical protein
MTYRKNMKIATADECEKRSQSAFHGPEAKAGHLVGSTLPSN